MGVHAAAGLQGVGLRNNSGENNCFLNAAVQGLWHCAHFCEWLCALRPKAYVVSQLPSLLHALACHDKLDAHCKDVAFAY